MAESAKDAEMNVSESSSCSVVVALLTYKRPELMANLLQKLTEIHLPEYVGLVVMVIDNDEEKSGQLIARQFKPKFENLLYFSETRRGIPVARNRAIDEALALEADILCFIDDDEYPDKDWLLNLIECWQNKDLHLVGGPVFVAPPPNSLSTWQCFIHKGLAKRAIRKMNMTARAAQSGGRYTIVTNNWLCDLKWLGNSKIRFNEKLLHTGGSDTEFFRRATAAGCKIRWCSKAFVYEIILPERLTMNYQFSRAAYQSMNHFSIKYRDPGPHIILAALLSATLKFISGTALLFVPVFGIASPVIGVRSIGWSFGRVQAILGKRSRLYD